MVSRLIPSPSAEETLEAFELAVADYVEDGVTTAVIAAGARQSLVNLQRARSAGLLTLRIVTMMSCGEPGRPSAAEAGGAVSGFGDERLKLGAIKIVQDESNQGYT